VTRARIALAAATAAALAFALTSAACGNKSGPAGPRGKPATREEALVAWETVRGVLQHPRCQNCHPDGDAPLQGEDGHRHLQNVLRGPEGKGMVGMECTTCHGPANPPSSYGTNIPPGTENGWHMPTPELKLVFVGVPSGALCEQIKDPARNGGKDMAALRVHLDDPLVLWGWNPGFGRAPVSTPRDQFLTAWETWASGGAPCPSQ
jgi:hypothetical protein